MNSFTKNSPSYIASHDANAVGYCTKSFTGSIDSVSRSYAKFLNELNKKHGRKFTVISTAMAEYPLGVHFILTYHLEGNNG